VTAHAAGNVREDDVPVVEFNGKRGTWEDLLDAAGNFDWALFDVLRGVGLGLTRTSFSGSITDGY
jgi:hypothetical protein